MKFVSFSKSYHYETDYALESFLSPSNNFQVLAKSFKA